MFISTLYQGRWYVAERTWRQGHSSAYRWQSMSVLPADGPTQVNPRQVPRHIRKQAYNYFWSQS